jgi:hypothetical protein
VWLKANGRATRRGTRTTVAVQATWLRPVKPNGSRAPMANKLAVQGSRLGLFIVQQTVKAHDGTAELRSATSTYVAIAR